MTREQHMKRESQRVSVCDFGAFSATENGEWELTASATYDVGEIVRDEMRPTSKGDLWIVTEVGKSWTVNPADPTHMQRFKVRPVNDALLPLLQAAFCNGWMTNDFISSHLDQDEMTYEDMHRAMHD